MGVPEKLNRKSWESLRRHVLVTSLVSFCLAFYLTVLEDFGFFSIKLIWAMLSEHTHVFVLSMAGGFGGSLALPLLISGLFVIFPFKSRKAVFLGVFTYLNVLVIIINLIAHFLEW